MCNLHQEYILQAWNYSNIFYACGETFEIQSARVNSAKCFHEKESPMSFSGNFPEMEFPYDISTRSHTLYLVYP